MKHPVIILILFFTSTWQLLYASNGIIEIEHHDTNYTNGNWTFQPDTFKIPSEMCSSDISGYCKAMGGHSDGGCECKCNSERTTFGFYDGRWNCTANGKIRQHGGCSLLLLKNRKADSALITIALNMERDILYEMPTNHKRCYIIPYKSTYMLCNGSWITLHNNFVFDTFEMVGDDGTQFLKLLNTWDSTYEKFKGRILRITIGCYNGSNARIPNCLVLKMQGTMKCPQFSLPPLPELSTSPSTIPSTSQTEPQTIPRISTLTPTTMVQSTAELQHRATSMPTMGSPSTHSHNREKNTAEEDGGNTGLIVGIAVGVLSLILLIVAIMVIRRRRTNRNAGSAKSNTVENVGYELGVDNSFKFNDHRPQDQDEYSYAYANALPLGRRNRSKNDRPDNEGPQTTVSNLMYGKIENLDQHRSPSTNSAAVNYNPTSKVHCNEPSCEGKGGEQSEDPFYNVLEDSGSSNGPTGSEPPCYDVLEGPFLEGAPYYSVLEKRPSSNEPSEYRSLDGPNDPSVYSVLNRDGIKRPVKQARNYNDTVYDSVGEVINDTSDVYHKLDQNSQMNIGVYQKLQGGGMLNQHDLTSHSDA